MAFNIQAIRYGWVALASLGVITGTTIYVANNQRHQVKPEDIIEIALGTYERCLATQYSTNPISYYVSPPSFVRTWTSNVYTTNGVTSYTNIVTNTIGWHIDRAMMAELDGTIKALVPWFVDHISTSLYARPTALTVTGLWASLQIGDKTNQFTRTPCWTNPVSTNWIVNYTSYWPSTNGAMTNIIYTSDYRQVVSYAQSWTATGGHVWVTSSNWDSEVVTVTNVVTYGDYPWQVSVEDLQERYKVLYTLCDRAISPDVTIHSYEVRNAGAQNQTSWGAAKNLAESRWLAGGDKYPVFLGVWAQLTHFGGDGSRYASLLGSSYLLSKNLATAGLSTNRISVRFWVMGTNEYYTTSPYGESIYDDNGSGVPENYYVNLLSLDDIIPTGTVSVIVGVTNYPFPNWPPIPPEATEHFTWTSQGFSIADAFCVISWSNNFQYCTNKYW